jgi:hypothetical protein
MQANQNLCSALTPATVRFYQVIFEVSHDGEYEDGCLLGCCAVIAQMMEAASTSETSANFYHNTQRNNPDIHFQMMSCLQKSPVMPYDLYLLHFEGEERGGGVLLVRTVLTDRCRQTEAVVTATAHCGLLLRQ